MVDNVQDFGSQDELAAVRISGVEYPITSTAEDYIRLIEFFEEITSGKDVGDLKRFGGNMDFARAALGTTTVEAMIADRVPLSSVSGAAQYAFWAITAGREKADMLTAQNVDEPETPGDGLPKASKSGPNTGSASRTKTGSTKGTGSRSTSGKSSTRKPAAKK